MRNSTRKIMLTGFTALSLAIVGPVFAQGGGNGQGGTGGGNAHSAATAGMTYRGDPINQPMSGMQAGSMSKMDSGNAPMGSMPANDPMAPAKASQ
ncbi:hypothetical protein P3T18_002926 [Paraburkholderia sp. GAS199]|uniref:hypothetical protein n=1 Tax=Paraburkholderia sp. GAS199 TaxID=3035126 RepID=UPI003D1F351D